MRTRQRTSDGTTVFPVLMRWFVLLLLPAPAWACPTGADMETGVVLTLEDGTTELYRRTAPDTVLIDVSYQDGHKSRNVLIHGVFIKQLSDVENGVVNIADAWLTGYDSPPPKPVPGGFGTINTMTGTMGDLQPEVQTFTWGELSPMTIGGCTYDSIPGVLTYKTTDYEVTETIRYLPELGLGLLLTYAEPGYDTDVFTYIGIATK